MTVKSVAPLAGAWIETQRNYFMKRNYAVAPLAGAWIETYRMSRYLLELRVAPTGGALCKTSIDILVSVTWFLLVSRLKRSCVSIVI